MSDEPQDNSQPDTREPDAMRQAELRAAYQKGSETPYKGVRIRTLGEVQWIMHEYKRAGAPGVPSDMTQANLSEADLHEVNLGGADLSGANLGMVDLIGANLGGANLSRANLSGAKLVRANLSGADFREANLSGAELRANLSRADLRGANLSGSHMSWATEGGVHLPMGATVVIANLSEAWLSGANLSGADLIKANLSMADLYEANLGGALLYEANLNGARLSKANLSGVDLHEANLSGADLSSTEMDARTTLDNCILDIHTRLGDIRWNGTPLLRIRWGQMLVKGQMHIGDEDRIMEPTRKDGQRRPRTRQEQQQVIWDAARAYRGLGRELKDQNLTRQASLCRLREQRLERRALLQVRRPTSFLGGIGSWLLDLVSGYGEVPARTFLAYLLVVSFFAVLNYLVTNIAQVGTSVARLSWDESLVLSLTSFHGRGFFPGYLQLNDWVARIGAVEAVLGLFIELILIATFSRRFLGD